MTDEELIKELFDRALKSEVFCARVINMCKDFINYLNEEE